MIDPRDDHGDTDSQTCPDPGVILALAVAVEQAGLGSLPHIVSCEACCERLEIVAQLRSAVHGPAASAEGVAQAAHFVEGFVESLDLDPVTRPSRAPSIPAPVLRLGTLLMAGAAGVGASLLGAAESSALSPSGALVSAALAVAAMILSERSQAAGA